MRQVILYRDEDNYWIVECPSLKGCVRQVKFLEPMTANILSNHRIIPPFGLAGGEAGKVGKNWVKRVDGTEEILNNTATVEMQQGDIFIIETPGGGGFGNNS